MNAKGDRLSNLPDELIHKIISFVDIKQAIETSALSSRWRYLWTSMPYINFSTKDFQTLHGISKFVTSFLSNRNDQSQVFSLSLAIWQEQIGKKVLSYAFSHNIQQLNITCFSCLPRQSYHLARFPPLFSCQSLKHLSLTSYTEADDICTTRPTWSMPALTTLILDNVFFYDDNYVDIISSCANLKYLTLKNLTLKYRGNNSFTWSMPALATLILDSVTFYENKYVDIISSCANLKNVTLKNLGCNNFSIRHPGLSSLTLEYYGREKFVNVDTPQLKNLTIKRWRGIHVLSAPNLSSLHYEDRYYNNNHNDAGDGPLQLPTNLRHLENVDICIYTCSEKKESTINKIVACLLQRLHSVKKLTLNLDLYKCFTSVERIWHQPSPLVNLKSLKSLKIYPTPVYMSAEAKKYLLKGCPDATLTMVSREH